MSFWIKVDVERTGKVFAQTFVTSVSGDPLRGDAKECVHGNTVSQTLRALASKMSAPERVTNGR